MAKIYQIGAGVVGRAMALDLAKKHQVHLADFDSRSLDRIHQKNNTIQIQTLDVTHAKSLKHFIEPADIVLLAVPGFLGYKALQAILETGKNVVDISFSPENVLELSSLAKINNVTAIVDAGVAPGIPNFLLGYYHSKMTIDSFEYYVGGLPKYPIPPFNYKAPFSPVDVIEEYTRPARMMINGEIVTRPALSEIEIKNFLNVGELEAFNTDGLRSILSTMNHIPNMKEKTLRYPGHATLMKTFRDDGKFDSNQIENTSTELFKSWRMDDNELEFTILDVIMRNESQTISYHLYDETDMESGIASMSRTTGYTATATINLILDGHFSKVGVFPPELVGSINGCWNYIKTYLNNRGVYIKKV